LQKSAILGFATVLCFGVCVELLGFGAGVEGSCAAEQDKLVNKPSINRLYLIFMRIPENRKSIF
jgi:hypothetical protein